MRYDIKYEAITIIHFWLTDLERGSALKPMSSFSITGLPGFAKYVIVPKGTVHAS